MGTPRYRAWRFLNPGLNTIGDAAGLRASNRGGIEMVEGRASVRQAILMLLATQPGERVMRPRYGCNLNWLVFSPNDETTAGLAIHYVRQALERWEPRIDIIHLDAVRSPGDEMTLEIHLEYRVRATLQTEALTYAFYLTGERT